MIGSEFEGTDDSAYDEPEDYGLLKGIPDDDQDEATTPEQLRIRRDDPSGTIILDRPGCSNALSRRLIKELMVALEDLRQVRSVRAVILIGSGDVFSAGTDLKELEGQLADDDSRHLWAEDTERLRQLLVQMLNYPKPIIAAINGPVCGTGMALALACDLVVASQSATFSLPEAKRGLVATQTLPLLSFRVGASTAAYLAFTGQTLDAPAAHRLGLVHELTTADLVWVRAQELAKVCASGARESLQLSKQILNETIGETLETYHAVAAAYAATARTTETAKEGVQAFLEKRPPRWK